MVATIKGGRNGTASLCGFIRKAMEERKIAVSHNLANVYEVPSNHYVARNANGNSMGRHGAYARRL